ncbi:hypothetical protein BN1110_05489 [bacterium YEK0313]|nr:hypothetical protein BN1110_05489 [bacterium YEK0313]
MNRLGSLLLRVLRAIVAFVVALALACAIVLVFDLNKGRIPEPLAGSLIVGFLMSQVAWYVWPLLIAVLAAEVLRWRSLLVYLAFGLAGSLGALGLVLLKGADEAFDPLLDDAPAFTMQRLVVHVVAGLASGFLYWLVAGRSAGANSAKD